MPVLNDFIRRRDEASFRILYRRHTPMIYAMALRMTGSRASAEELVQEAWVRAVERLDRFARQSKFSTWLAGILINSHRELRRREKRDQPLDDSRMGKGAEVVEAFPAEYRLQADPADLEQALTQLADGYREVVVLHDLYGYTHEEIADLLGVRSGTSKSQLARGRAQLRRYLTQLPAQASNSDGSTRP